MTDFSAMPAGPEMDSEIARRVFGQEPHEMCWRYKDDRCNGDTLTVCGACGRDGHGNCYGDGSGPVQIECCRELPSYSSSIEHAWTVVEKMRERGLMVTLTSYPPDLVEGGGWWCSLDSPVSSFHRYQAQRCATAPIAICRAALSALDAER